MFKEENAQISAELVLIMATVSIIILITSNYIIDTLNQITLHVKIVIRNMRNDIMSNIWIKKMRINRRDCHPYQSHPYEYE